MRQTLQVIATAQDSSVKIKIKKVFQVGDHLHALVECKDDETDDCSDALPMLTDSVTVETKADVVLPVTYYLVNHAMRAAHNRHADFFDRYHIYETELSGIVGKPAAKFVPLTDVNEFDYITQAGTSVYAQVTMKKSLQELLEPGSYDSVKMPNEILEAAGIHDATAWQLASQYPASIEILTCMYKAGIFKHDEVTNHNLFHDVIMMCKQLHTKGRDDGEMKALMEIYQQTSQIMTLKAHNSLVKMVTKLNQLYSDLPGVVLLINNLLPLTSEMLVTLFKFPDVMISVYKTLENMETRLSYMYHLLLTQASPRDFKDFEDALDRVAHKKSLSWLTYERFLGLLDNFAHNKHFLRACDALNDAKLLDDYYERAIINMDACKFIPIFHASKVLNPVSMDLLLTDSDTMTCLLLANQVQVITYRDRGDELISRLLKLIIMAPGTRSSMLKINELYKDACAHIRLRQTENSVGDLRQLRDMVYDAITNLTVANSQGIFANNNMDCVNALEQEIESFISRNSQLTAMND